MSLFSFLAGQIEVRENYGVITVTGVKHAGNMINRIGKLFNTTRVPTYMFNTLASSKFSFYSYFALDVIYALRKLTVTKDAHLYVPEKTILSIIEKIEQETWVKNTFIDFPSKLNYNKLKDFNLTPMKHQSEFFEAYDSLTQKNGMRGMMTAAFAGSGKTLMSLMLTRMLEVDQVVIVAPKPTVYNVWANNITSYMVKPDTYWYSTSGALLKGNERFIIVHYEYLQKLIDQLKYLKGKTFAVVLDESHNLNEAGAARSKLFVQLCKQLKSKDVLWLSGTPFKALAMEAVPLISSIDPLFTPEVEERFKKVYAGTNIETNQMLNSRLQGYMRVVKKEVLALEKPIEETLKITIPNGKDYTLPAIKEKMKEYIKLRVAYYANRQKEDYAFYNNCLSIHEKSLPVSERNKFKDYKDAVAQIVKVSGVYYSVVDQMKLANQYEKNNILPSLPQDMRKQFNEVKTIYKYLSLKINGECLGIVVGGARIACHVDMVPFIPLEDIVDRTKKKTLIFSSFTEVVRAMEKKAKDCGLKPLTAFADNSKDLNNTVDKFTKDPNYDPLITTYATLSTGVPLIAADKVIFINSPWRSYILAQALARVHRLGQDSQVYSYKCELDTGEVPNISTRAGDILEWARDSVKQITGVDYIESNDDAAVTTQIGLENYQETYCKYL